MRKGRKRHRHPRSKAEPFDRRIIPNVTTLFQRQLSTLTDLEKGGLQHQGSTHAKAFSFSIERRLVDTEDGSSIVQRRSPIHDFSEVRLFDFVEAMFTANA